MFLYRNLDLLINLPENLENNSSDLVSLTIVVKGYERLNDLSILSDCIDSKDLCDKLMDYVFNVCSIF